MASCSLCTFSFILISFLIGIRASELSPHFYDVSCPNASNIILSEVRKAVANETRMAASLVRLHFHDCFVNGCDASVLLDDDTTTNFTGEKTAFPNVNSIRGFEVVDAIKAALEKECPGKVSCADILAVAARDSVVESQGNSWIVPLGRRDSLTANRTVANTDLPGPASNLSALISSFSKKGFTTTEMVILSGAHTFGQARCVTFRPHIYNDTNIDSAYAKSLQANCPTTVDGDNNLTDLDVTTENVFDNKYFINLMNKKGLLHSDQELYNGGLTDVTVALYAISPASLFLSDFGDAMVKMGNLSPLTGSDGEIRTNCRKRN